MLTQGMYLAKIHLSSQRGENSMKKSRFEYMIKNPPQGATHYRRFKRYVVFYKHVDNSFGSYSRLLWWADEDSPEHVWTVFRNFLDEQKVVKL